MTSKVKLFFVLFLSITTLYSCKDEKFYINKSEGSYIKVDDKFEGVKEIDEFLKPYSDTVEMRLNKKLSYTPIDLMSRGEKGPETLLGNLLSDCVFEQANLRYAELYGQKADFAVLNRGGIRANIPRGPITLRHMFEIMPFENTLLIVTISPEKVKEMLDYMAKSKGHPLANLSLVVSDGECKNVMIGNEKIDYNRSYKVVTTDYLQHGGDSMYFLSDPEKIDSLNYLMRDAMIDYFTKTDTVKVELDNRFTYENK